MNLEDFRRLYDYNSWANHRTAGSLRAAERRAIHARLTLQLSLRARHPRSYSSGRMVVARAMAGPFA